MLIYSILVGVLGVFVVVVVSYTRFIIPWFHLDARQFLAVIFFLIGLGFKEFEMPKFKRIIGFTAFTLVVIGGFFWRIKTAQNFYPINRIVPYILTAVLGTWSVYSLPWERLQGSVSQFILFIGNNTLTILTWHFLCFKILSLLLVNLYSLPIGQLAEFPTIIALSKRGWWLAYCITGIALPLLVAYLTSHHQKTNLSD